MPVAEIIAIGTELLLGEIQDTNTAYLARKLRDIGVDIFRATLVGDNEVRISELIKEAAKRADIVITTGGLGPTVDDPTRQAVALAVGSRLVFHEELWDQILNRFARFGRQPTENNRKQAFIPESATAIENPVGTAPSFVVDTGENVIISLPGVPREMEAIYEESVLPILKKRYDLKGVIQVRVLHLAGVGESFIDELIEDFETSANPTVGILAKSGQIDVRITAKAPSLEEAGQKIEEVEGLLRARLKDHVFGADDDTLENLILETLEKSGLKLAVIETASNKILSERLAAAVRSSGKVLVHQSACDPLRLKEEILSVKNEINPDVILAAHLEVGQTRHVLQIHLVLPGEEKDCERYFGGPPSMAPTWAGTTALDALRRSLA